jgi:hypothetical protein
MEVSFGSIRVEAHDGVGEAPLLVVLDSPAAEGAKDAKKKKRSNEQPGKGNSVGASGEVMGRV